MSSLSVELITDTEGLLRFHSEWLALYAQSPRASPFQSPDWLLPWWSHFGSGQLLCLVIRDAPTLVGFAPFFILPDSNGWRQLLLLGTGNSDYLDLLYNPGYESKVLVAVAQFLQQQKTKWDVCLFQGLKQDSPLRQLSFPVTWSFKQTVHDFCPILQLPAQFDTYLNGLPTGLRKNTKRALKQLELMHELHLDIAAPHNLQQALGDFFKLHRLSWNFRGGEGVLADPRLGPFFSEVSDGLLAHGELRLFRLLRDGEPLACTYSLVRGGTLYYYLAGFDPDFRQFSPGSVMIFQLIQELLRSGIRRVDFLRGREPYKYKWGAVDEPVSTLAVLCDRQAEAFLTKAAAC